MDGICRFRLRWGGVSHNNCVKMPGLPPAQGLYDPAHEHDACGVGFVVHVKGRVARDRRAGAAGPDQSAASRRLRLRGQHRRRRRHPDSDAGPVPPAEAARLGFALPPERRLRRGLRLPPARRRPARRDRSAFEAIVAEEGQRVLGWRDVPTDDSSVGAERGRRRAASSARCSSAAAPAFDARRTDADLRVRAQALRDPQAHRARRRRDGDCRIAARSTSPACRRKTLIYKGMLTADQIAPMFPDLADPDVESALALVHQRFSTNTFPSLAARASLPLRRAQRRDQHAARQHQLDAGARGAARVGRASATT